MRLLLTILIIAILGGIAEWTGIWWLAAVVACMAGFLSGLSAGRAFLAGLLGIATLWLAVFLFRDLPNDHILSSRMAQLFKLPSYLLYLLVTVSIGGLTGGLAAWSGAQLRLLFGSRAAA